jgi:hypothetical protein
MIKALPFLRLQALTFLSIFMCTCCISFSARAFQADTSAYQTQRLKVNSLLTERSNKFGQYDQSLDQRTGIFGFQTKQDIKNSNEILRQIVLNDNNIFKELKILMDYKDQQVQQVRRDANNTSSRIQAYMLSIKKLQDQNELLKKEAESGKGGRVLFITIAVLSLIALWGTVYFFRNKLKAAGLS